MVDQLRLTRAALRRVTGRQPCGHSDIMVNAPPLIRHAQDPPARQPAGSSSFAGCWLGVMTSSGGECLAWLRCLLRLFFSHWVTARLRRKVSLHSRGGGREGRVGIRQRGNTFPHLDFLFAFEFGIGARGELHR